MAELILYFAGIVGAMIVGVFFVVPVFIKFCIGVEDGGTGWRDRVLLRYQKLAGAGGLPILRGNFAWVFAWFKLRLDPMFGELPAFLEEIPDGGKVLDIGCGYGVAGCAALEWRSGMTIFGIDPDPARVRVAAAVFGDRGSAVVGVAPDIETKGDRTLNIINGPVPFSLPDWFDAILVLDVIHFISDRDLEVTLQRIRAKLVPKGHLVIRSIIPPGGGGATVNLGRKGEEPSPRPSPCVQGEGARARGSRAWKFARVRRILTGGYACHRSVEKIGQMINAAGFELVKTQNSGGNAEMVWFIARARDGEEGGSS